MKNSRLLILLIATFISVNSYSQNEFDVRKAKWGMTIAQIKDSELPLTPTKEEPSIGTNGAKTDLVYENVIINDIKTTLYFTFQNGKLLEITYAFNKTWQKADMKFSDKVMSTQFIYKSLINEKKMQPLDCWMYDDFNLKYYESFTKNKTCEYSSVELLDDIEKVGLKNNFKQVTYRLKNKRSYVLITYELANEDAIYNKFIGWVKISAHGDALKDTKDSGF